MIIVKGGHAVLKGSLLVLAAEFTVAAKAFVETNVSDGIEMDDAVLILRKCVELALGEEKGEAENV